MSTTNSVRWRVTSFILALRIALLTIIPQPAVVLAASPESANSLPTKSAAEQWLGQPDSGYNLTVATSRRQESERAATAVSTRATIARERAVPAVEILSRERVETLIDQYAAKYQVSSTIMRGIIKCESGYNQLAKNKRSSAAGFAQFLDGTWKSAMKSLGYGLSFTQYDGDKNLEALAYVLHTQGTRPWNASKACWSR
jgi:soluble lytic murein transglycosylase-like protein